jgi:hypothetical protein
MVLDEVRKGGGGEGPVRGDSLTWGVVTSSGSMFVLGWREGGSYKSHCERMLAYGSNHVVSSFG